MKKNFTQIILCSSFLLLFIFSARGQQIAFPGAEGAGRFASGGRGTATLQTTVYEVTNLNDDNNPGSLRYALSQSAVHRTVVFRISGTIHLTSRLTIKGNTTIAGQTAPGEGICIADYPTAITGSNVIVRYMRFRMGDKNQLKTTPVNCGVPVPPFSSNPGCVPTPDVSGNDDAFGSLDNSNIIIDHCTVSWSSDEALTIYRGDSLTLQWNIVSEPLNYSYHVEPGDEDYERHGFGGIWGAKNGSAHHNLIADAQGRSPRFAGSSSYTPNTAGTENVDFRNNVIYNWGGYSTNGGDGGNYNMVNNYYKYGPSTNTGTSVGVSIRNQIMNPGKSTNLPYPKLYLSGNYVDGSTVVTQNNWLGVSMSGGVQADTILSKVTTPFSIGGAVATQTAAAAYELVLQYAGASYKRDTLDIRITNDVRNRTGRIIDVQGGYAHGTPYATTVNAWPNLQSAVAPLDTDHDGMPDSWETTNGLNPNDANDRGVFATNGYTNLENYLNGILNAPTISSSANTLNGFTQSVGTPSNVQTYILSAQNLTNNITITPPAGYQVSGDGGIAWFSNSSPLSLNQTNGTLQPITISVRLNAGGAGTFNGTITHATTGAANLNMAVNGTAFISNTPPGTNVIVAKDGTGNYTTIQAAIDAAPTGRTTPYIIFIKNGKYKEKVMIPSNKPFIQLVGESAAYTIVSWNDGASTPLPGGGTVGTFNSYTLFVQANDCGLLNLTIENTFGEGSQAVALRIDADRVIVKRCRILGNQDTMLNNANAGLRQYFNACYIDGNVDYIFGSARVIIDSTVIYSKDRTTSGNSFLTAANTQAGQPYGYVFRDCILPPNLGVTNYFLGRPWQNSTGSSPIANNKTVFINSVMSTSVLPAGWSTWDAGTNTSLIYYGEYKTKKFDGSLVNISSRVPWSFQLSDAAVASYTNANLLGTWDPCSAGAIFCTNAAKEIAISNFRGKKTATNAQFNWNISWAMPQIKYELYRSGNRNGGYSKVGEMTSLEDTTYNFQLTDALPASGTSAFYYVTGSKPGYLTHITDTVEISNIPTITAAGSLSAYAQNFGSPSGTQVVVVSGVNLAGNIIVAPPAPFEVSNNGTVWYTSSNPLVLVPSSGTLANTNLSIRLNASILGSFAGNIQLTSSGAQANTIAVTGTCSIIPQPTTQLLQHWPLSTGNADSLLVRHAGVTANSPIFNRFTPSNGTTVVAVPAYSSLYGQAFSSMADGSGLWTTASGGPGGNLNRTYYEQFAVTASAGYTVKVDSLIFSSAFYGSSSNTKVGVVYSKTGFVSDSADVATIPGGFISPNTLNNQTAGVTDTYAAVFAASAPITLNPGQSLTFRLYFSCGSTSPGRYALLKNVKVIGSASSVGTPAPVVTTTGTLNPFVQLIGGASSAQTYSINGSGLTGKLYLVAPANFEISINGGTTWVNSTLPIVLTPVNGNISATVSVRLNAGVLGTYNGNIQHITTGVTSINIPVSGNTVPLPSVTLTGNLNTFVHNMGVPSAVQSYVLNGSNMTGNLTVTPPIPYEVSLNGINWFTNASPLIIMPSAGSINSTVQVRLNGVVAGSYAGDITHITNNSATKTITVTGNTLSEPVLNSTGAMGTFIQKLPAPSPIQSYTLTGSNVLSSVTITPPPYYQVSIDNGLTWSRNPLTVAPVNGSLNATINVRLNTFIYGTYTGEIVHSLGNTISKIAVNGYATPKEDYTLYPNPVYRILHFNHPVSTESGVLNFYTMNGIKIKTVAVPAGSFITVIDVSLLPQAQYIIEYMVGSTRVVKSFQRY